MYMYLYQSKLARHFFNLSEELIPYFTTLHFCKFVVHTVSFVMVLLLTKSKK